VRIFLIDGTYELFRQFFGQPSAVDDEGNEFGATRGVLTSVVQLLEEGATHVGVATDHVIESFRNEMFYGYKTGEGIDPALYSQFPLLEDALKAMGVYVWDMIELEADDALASAAVVASGMPDVEQVVIMTPDKDLHQIVDDARIVQYDRRNQKIINKEGVKEKLGIEPESVPDYLALVGDSADGIPGIAGWGAKSTSNVLAKFKHLEDIPQDSSQWELNIRGAKNLAGNLFDSWKEALLYRDLATLRIDPSLLTDLNDLKWAGVNGEFGHFVRKLRLDRLVPRIEALTSSRS
jgi:5'-3' exonuclease